MYANDGTLVGLHNLGLYAVHCASEKKSFICHWEVNKRIVNIEMSIVTCCCLNCSHLNEMIVAIDQFHPMCTSRVYPDDCLYSEDLLSYC